MFGSLQLALLCWAATPAAPALPEAPAASVPEQAGQTQTSPPARTAEKSALGLRRVAFVQRPSGRHLPPDLRDPFGPRPAPPQPRDTSIPSDLRDPFHVQKPKAPATTVGGDLRDPFERQPEPPACPETTEDGVKLQRPAALRKDRCERAEQQWTSPTLIAAASP